MISYLYHRVIMRWFQILHVATLHTWESFPKWKENSLLATKLNCSSAHTEEKHTYMKKKKHRRNVDFNKFIRLTKCWWFPLSLIVPPHPPSHEPRVWEGLDGEKQGLDTTNTYRHIKPPSIKLTFLLSSPAQIFLFTLNFHLPGLLQEMVELR